MTEVITRDAIASKMSHLVNEWWTDDSPGQRWPLGHNMKQLVCSELAVGDLRDRSARVKNEDQR